MIPEEGGLIIGGSTSRTLKDFRLPLFFTEELQAAKMLSILKESKLRCLFYLLCIPAVIGVLLTWEHTLHSLGSQQSSLCACHKCLNDDDPGFRKVVNASHKPFLSRNDKTSKGAFNWWKKLQWERRDFSFFQMTVDKLFHVFPPVPDVVESSPDRCRTCAVVGNSGNLKGSYYGPLIDFHDIVIRMNRGRTKGYEKDVGTKTTHHVMYPESAIYLDNTTHLVLFSFKIRDLEWLLNAFEPANANSKSRANKDLVMILNPAFMKYVHETWLQKKGRYPSTGFMTLILSLQICDEVSVFGFGADRDGAWNHYYEVLQNKNFRTGPHPGSYESEVIEQLVHSGKILLFKGE
uniref:CMP-N-acetylneuraminate-beta-galactosamide- alpha-2,3-sialyltransferase 1-like n=1 Tax=Semicossyphus pulcher TaxID=241346 RepID=UPI0037E73DA7